MLLFVQNPTAVRMWRSVEFVIHVVEMPARCEFKPL